MSLAFGGDIPLWGGIVAAPIIGFLMGVIARPVHKWRTGWRVVFAIGSLYLAVAFFGLAASVPKIFDSHSSLLDIVFAPLAFIVGIHLYPFWVVLIPLAIINHYLLGTIDGA